MLSVQGLSTSYSGTDGTVVRAANDISFEVPTGKMFTLLGPSGCGKTTVLRSVAGLERPDAGEIRAGGTVVFSSARKIFMPPDQRRFGMVFQSYAIWPHLTVYENAAFPLRVGPQKLSEAQIRAKVERVLGAVALTEFAGRDATKLSGGQQQRLSLARALVMEPKLLLLDEPLSNLDAKLREQMRFELKRLQRELSLTTLYVTHDQAEALALSHEIAVLRDGRIEQIGAPRAIYEAPRTRFVADFVGTTNFVDGRIIGTEGGEFVVETEIGTLRVASREALAVGERVSLSIRPENIRLHEGEAAGALRGKIDSKLFLGEAIDVQVRLNDRLLIARAHPSLTASTQSPIGITVPPGGCAVVRH